MKVVVQKEIAKEKCNKCNKYGQVKTQEFHGGFYYPYCTCSFGVWKNQQDDGLDMFSRNR